MLCITIYGEEKSEWIVLVGVNKGSREGRLMGGDRGRKRGAHNPRSGRVRVGEREKGASLG